MPSLDSLPSGWIGVLGNPQMWAHAPATLYAEELLAQAGVLNWRWIASVAELADPAIRLALVPNARLLDRRDLTPIREFLGAGGRLLVLGRPNEDSPLAELFGVRVQPPVREGWLVPGAGLAGAARMKSAWRIPLHVFDLAHLLPGPIAKGHDWGSLPTPARPPGPLNFSVGNHAVNWPVSASVQVGSGSAMLIAADLLASVVRIQQGLAIHHDGVPAPDGTAPIDDGILKCDDSIMLDWTRDRQQPIADLPPIFLQPQCDLIRELLIAAILDLAEGGGQQGQPGQRGQPGQPGVPLILLDNWPRQLPAVGLISHDSDGHAPDAFARQLATDGEADVVATWCCMAGDDRPGADGGKLTDYSPEILARIAASGHEIALHYDAFTDHPACRWGPDTLRAQIARLRQQMRAVGIDSPVYSNKNHYTRWEGRLEFFHWLLSIGVRVDQSKGPSKAGELGWPFGSCHPWRPIDDEVSPPHLMDLLEIGMATQDLGVEKNPAQFGRHYIDTAVARGGVAHLLFHPAHTHRDEIRRNLVEHVAYGRAKGMEWWTSRQIGHWQFARRSARLVGMDVEPHRVVLQIEAAKPLEGAVLRVAGPAKPAKSAPTALAGKVEVAIMGEMK